MEKARESRLSFRKLEQVPSMAVIIHITENGQRSIRQRHGRPREMNNKGIVDEYRRPKAAYTKVAEIFKRYSDYYDSDKGQD